MKVVDAYIFFCFIGKQNDHYFIVRSLNQFYIVRKIINTQNVC